ncbi:MAG: hypothetical protein CVU57_20985 [Deltaproteobacteria bacterium HGW-Deltaproteobacteria-15]|jgi:hypothetical protein|nr:MAG: hypothetical protein CVU57_20985 [Deltaproteobacteria bacterium HGW-Deltaproteobacteria-15]
MLNPELFKPIRNLGLFLIILGLAGFLFHVLSLGDPQYTIGFQLFLTISAIFYLLLGWNIVSRNRWGFRSLKLILYLLYPGFPLGTYFSRRTLRYIKEFSIQRYFENSMRR